MWFLTGLSSHILTGFRPSRPQCTPLFSVDLHPVLAGSRDLWPRTYWPPGISAVETPPMMGPFPRPHILAAHEPPRILSGEPRTAATSPSDSPISDSSHGLHAERRILVIVREPSMPRSSACAYPARLNGHPFIFPRQRHFGKLSSRIGQKNLRGFLVGGIRASRSRGCEKRPSLLPYRMRCCSVCTNWTIIQSCAIGGKLHCQKSHWAHLPPSPTLTGDFCYRFHRLQLDPVAVTVLFGLSYGTKQSFHSKQCFDFQ
ncbi:hypothetical protein FB45DRAFT_169143 [Roridomyces roridus]|uniref:Uncharacterized protein n=1 Tax=Roridomyces roridus TaxID=1738132 RepID=A0AAD7AYT7_9AGAR|nr:hypothetical protein FB45DRAFT_561934 [Roridomyces roridus]KAJ7618558.1 hypothetical protein FB45DRAFT_169143 [Roridomyces roridus]